MNKTSIKIAFGTVGVVALLMRLPSTKSAITGDVTIGNWFKNIFE